MNPFWYSRSTELGSRIHIPRVPAQRKQQKKSVQRLTPLSSWNLICLGLDHFGQESGAMFVGANNRHISCVGVPLPYRLAVPQELLQLDWIVLVPKVFSFRLPSTKKLSEALPISNCPFVQ